MTYNNTDEKPFLIYHTLTKAWLQFDDMLEPVFVDKLQAMQFNTATLREAINNSYIFVQDKKTLHVVQFDSNSLPEDCPTVHSFIADSIRHNQ